MVKEETIEQLADYNISDVFVPGKSLKHLPRALRTEDVIIRTYELFVLAGVNVAAAICTGQ